MPEHLGGVSGSRQLVLLAHSAGAVLATLYAAAYPERLSRLILVTPGLAAVGAGATGEQVRAALARRAAEPWYPGCGISCRIEVVWAMVTLLSA